MTDSVTQSDQDGLEILYINNTSFLAEGGGGEERADEITKRLAENGHHVTAILGKTAPDLPKRVSDAGRQFRHVTCIPDFVFRHRTLGFYLARYLFAFVSIPVLISMLWRDEFDVIVETMTPYPTFAAVIASIFDVPITGVRHEFFDRSCYDVYDPLTATIQLAVQNFLRVFEYAALIVPATPVKQNFVDYGVPERRIEVIPNGVNHQRYRRPAIESESGRLLVLGRLTKRKGQARLIRVLRTLRDDGYDAQLDIVGDGPARSQLATLVRDLGLDAHVTFHGFVDEEEKVELLNRVELFVFASRQEGFGIVLLEAMAAGLPIVARWLPVYDDFFEDPENGRLLRDGSVGMFADEIEALLDAPEERAEIRANNRETAARYSWDAAADRMERTLERICEQRTYDTPPSL